MKVGAPDCIQTHTLTHFHDTHVGELTFLNLGGTLMMTKSEYLIPDYDSLFDTA